MHIFITIVLLGALFGTIGGGALHGTDGMILGGSSGFVVATGTWLLTDMISYSLRERRLNHYFTDNDNQ